MNTAMRELRRRAESDPLLKAYFTEDPDGCSMEYLALCLHNCLTRIRLKIKDDELALADKAGLLDSNSLNELREG